MGRYFRTKPDRLPEKLIKIRTTLGLSQNGLIKHLGLDEVIYQSHISGYELGTREPTLPILLKYAQAAGVWVDVLIDDELDLPEKLPSPIKHEGIKRKAGARGKKR